MPFHLCIDRMHPLQCHGPLPRPSILPDSPVISSSSSPASSFSDARLDSAHTVTSESSQSPVAQDQPQPQEQQQEQPVRRLKRRASQGSIFPKPSSVSRFLSRNPAAGLGAGPARTQSLDSRLRLSTATPTSSPPAPVHPSLSTWQGDYPSTLPPTPPEDNDENVARNSNSNSSMLLVESHHINPAQAKEPLEQSPSMENTPRPILTADGLSSPSDQLSSAAASPPGSTDMDCDYDTWLENGIHAAISALPCSDGRGEAVKIVSQTLPYPRAADKSVTLPTHDSVFATMVQAVQNRMQQGQSPYINITHAVPEQFSLSNLPTSPPSTPLSPGEDYFNSTVFSNAAVVSTYHDFRGPVFGMQSHLPMPVVPPHTIHLSVLERYLPPSSAQEHRDLFSPSRPSYLVDRISELSPDNGSLLFIYPTKRGGATFKSQYLGPILDPLLRQLVVVNELSADVSRYLGKLSSVSQMDDFESMKANLSHLCDTLSCSSPSSHFSVVDSRKGNVSLDRNLWTEWFIHQEKSRMKEVLNLYWQNGRRLPVNKTSTSSTMRSNFMLADKEVTSAMLLGDILDGIRRRPYGEENQHQDGVELGVFVIRRSK